MLKLEKVRFLNGNQIKIIAAISMLLDHIGVTLYPQNMLLRILGRAAMPFFAFMIAEGCRYTKNKPLHLGLIAGFGVAFQTVYYLFCRDTYLNIFITFSLSILVIYAMQHFKKCLFDKEKSLLLQIASGLLFVGSICFVWIFCAIGERYLYYTVDYGFWGCMLPVFASIFDFHQTPAPTLLQKTDCLPLRVCAMILGYAFFQRSSFMPQITMYAFAFIPLLFFYNGKKGKANMKYFFYIFYPAHLVLLQAIAMFLV